MQRSAELLARPAPRAPAQPHPAHAPELSTRRTRQATRSSSAARWSRTCGHRGEMRVHEPAGTLLPAPPQHLPVGHLLACPRTKSNARWKVSSRPAHGGEHDVCVWVPLQGCDAPVAVSLQWWARPARQQSAARRGRPAARAPSAEQSSTKGRRAPVATEPSGVSMPSTTPCAPAAAACSTSCRITCVPQRGTAVPAARVRRASGGPVARTPPLANVLLSAAPTPPCVSTSVTASHLQLPRAVEEVSGPGADQHVHPRARQRAAHRRDQACGTQAGSQSAGGQLGSDAALNSAGKLAGRVPARGPPARARTVRGRDAALRQRAAQLHAVGAAGLRRQRALQRVHAHLHYHGCRPGGWRGWVARRRGRGQAAGGGRQAAAAAATACHGGAHWLARDHTCSASGSVGGLTRARGLLCSAKSSRSLTTRGLAG